MLVSNFKTCGYSSTLGVGPGRDLEAKHPSVVVHHLVRLGLSIDFIDQVPRRYLWLSVYLVGKNISYVLGLFYLSTLRICTHPPRD